MHFVVHLHVSSFCDGVGVLFCLHMSELLIYKSMHQQTQQCMDCVCLFALSAIVYIQFPVLGVFGICCLLDGCVIQYYGTKAHCQLAIVGKLVGRVPVNMAHHMSQKSGQETYYATILTLRAQVSQQQTSNTFSGLHCAPCTSASWVEYCALAGTCEEGVCSAAGHLYEGRHPI